MFHASYRSIKFDIIIWSIAYNYWMPYVTRKTICKSNLSNKSNYDFFSKNSFDHSYEGIHNATKLLMFFRNHSTFKQIIKSFPGIVASAYSSDIFIFYLFSDKVTTSTSPIFIWWLLYGRIVQNPLICFIYIRHIRTKFNDIFYIMVFVFIETKEYHSSPNQMYSSTIKLHLWAQYLIFINNTYFISKINNYENAL